MGAKFAIAVGNGTDALYLALKAFNIGKGDEVITTPFTFIATVASIVTAGAKPVFVDIKDDYNIDEKKIEKAITKKTKAIMPVHWAGRPCELDKIRKIANKYKLKVIQDSCHAIDLDSGINISYLMVMSVLLACILLKTLMFGVMEVLS